MGNYTLTARATDNSGTMTTSAAVNISVTLPGATIAGRVTRTDGVTAIAGAAIRALQGTTVPGTATSNASGDYSVTGLAAGTYSVEASAAGYTTRTQNGVSGTSGATTTVNFSLDAPINYVYDELGRLVGVVDQGGQAAVYSYDSVGNLLAISRLAASQTGIIRFSPASGPIGTTVTVYGTGFSATASQNTVAFNGTAASVVSSSPSQIVTAVPAGATTGPITVTSPAGSATSSASFTVGSAPRAPTITGFTPAIGDVGAAVTVNGSGFESIAANNRLAFNGISGIVSTAAAGVITGATPVAGSGHISVSTPNGTAVSSADFFIPPPGYSANSVGFSGRVSIGSSITVALASNQIGLVVFDGVAGRQISLQTSNASLISSIGYYNLDATTLLTLQNVSSQTGNPFIDAVSLPVTGTYAMLIAGVPSSGSSGSVTIRLYDATVVTGTILPGGPPVTVNITTPGQNAALTFSGSPGQRVSLRVSSGLSGRTLHISAFSVRAEPS